MNLHVSERGCFCGDDVASHPNSLSDLAKQKIMGVQDYAVLSAQSIANLFHYPRYLADTIIQADSIGVGSLPIVLLTGLSVGAELALNSASTLQKFGALAQIAELVSEGMIRELGPVITALMVAGRNASGIASELGSMRVTDQLDAMRALGTDPLKKLVSPRIVATVFMLFWLAIISDFLGLLGGAVISTLLDWRQYWHAAWQILDYKDLTIGLVKPPLFGFIIATIGCSYGMTTRGGTEGVGKSTTQAVVASCVLILIVPPCESPKSLVAGLPYKTAGKGVLFMLAKEVMTKDAVCCSRTTSVMNAAGMMRESDVGVLLVIDDVSTRRLIGVVTDRDLCLLGLREPHDAALTTVEDCMAADTVTCGPDDEVWKVLADMRCNQIRRIPVVDRNGVCGIIGISDLIHYNALAPAEICLALGQIMAPKMPVAMAREVKHRIDHVLRRNVEVDSDQITVDVVDDNVILEGQVSCSEERQEAERAAWSAPGVKEVEDKLVVAA